MSEVASAFHVAMSANVSNVSGAFRVRRSVSVNQFVREVISAVLSDSPEVEVNGIIIHRPATINIRMIGFREWQMTPDMPVSVSALGTHVSFDVSSVRFVKDDETGHPALMVTTASRLKPDVVIVFEVGEDLQPEIQQNIPSNAELEELFAKASVPSKHHDAIMNAVSVAWGPKQIAPVRMNAYQGPMTRDGSEKLAKLIVEDLVRHEVVSQGFFFWMQLGYWMIKIIAALIQARQGTS